MLYLVLSSTGKNVFTFAELFKVVMESNKDHYLPASKEKLFETLQYLHQTGLILFLRSPKGKWIVTDKETLLKEVNGTIFAPVNDKKFKHTEIRRNLLANSTTRLEL